MANNEIKNKIANEFYRLIQPSIAASKSRSSSKYEILSDDDDLHLGYRTIIKLIFNEKLSIKNLPLSTENTPEFQKGANEAILKILLFPEMMLLKFISRYATSKDMRNEITDSLLLRINELQDCAIPNKIFQDFVQHYGSSDIRDHLKNALFAFKPNNNEHEYTLLSKENGAHDDAIIYQLENNFAAIENSTKNTSNFFSLPSIFKKKSQPESENANQKVQPVKEKSRSSFLPNIFNKKAPSKSDAVEPSTEKSATKLPPLKK